MNWWIEFCNQFDKCFLKDNRYELFLEGIGATVRVSFFAVIIGAIIGFLICLCNISKNKHLKRFGGVYIDIIRGTPAVTQLMIIYFVIFASVHWAKWVIAAIAFGINSGAYVSEIFRAGVESLDKGQMEAGRSLGLSEFQTLRTVIFPQAIKNVFPSLCNEFIVLIKETAIVGYVGLMDIQKAGDYIKSATYAPFMPLMATAVIYYLVIKILTLNLKMLENKLHKADASLEVISNDKNN